MPSSSQMARYESKLGRAHRALWEAHSAAEQLQLEGAASDLEMLLRELTRIGEGALSRRPGRSVGPQIPGQTSIAA